MKKIQILISFGLVFTILLSACGARGTEEPDTKSPEMVLTAAAQTADAMVRTMAASSPSPLPVTPSPTSQITPSPQASPTTAANVTAAPTSVSTQGDKAEFVLDVTVPDGTMFSPNAAFIKTWRLLNSGTTTWSNAYTLVFASGDQMGAPASLALPAAVPPGQTIDISVSMIAPSQEGNYTANFLLANDSGQRFGLDPNAIQPFYVVIVVSNEGGTPASNQPTSTPTLGPSTTPGSGGAIVNWVFLSVDNANSVGCPHNFNFTGQVTLNNPTTLTYKLEVLSSDQVTPGPIIDPVTTNLPAGTHTVNFVTSLGSSFNGVARLHVTAPEDLYSNPVNFALMCNPSPAPTLRQ